MEESRCSKVTVEDIVATDNINTALEHLESKHNSCGLDGVKLSDIRDYWDTNKDAITLAIKDGQYIPGIVSVTEILKPNGKRRTIAKLNSIDRLILRAIVQVLAKIIEPKLPDTCFSYRQGRSASDAASQAAHKAERKSYMHWTLVYLLQNPDWTGEAICVDKGGKQPQWSIPSLALETYMTPKKEVELNEKVRVRAANINLPELTLDFIEV